MPRAIANAESTSYPVWIIATLGSGDVRFLAGPWFSRATAEAHLRGFRYRYGPRAVVYCASGEASDDYRHLCETGRLPGLEP